ncbi:MAG: HEAT repeat domain-containing protein [Deltaproteobacteria bacterium]|nr:HEAT repeat domain-containing protein [Deltaproteobacteria bacterium]
MPDASRPSPAPTPHRGARATRAKLVSLTVLANMTGLLIAIWVAKTLRSGHASDAAQTGWMFAYYGAMFVVAIVDAFLVDALLFGGSFRRKYLQGQDGRQLERQGDDEELAASFKTNGIGFPLVVVLCGGLTYLLFNFANGDFDTYHRTIGIHLSTLRNGDETERRAAVIELSVRRAPQVLPALEHALAQEGDTGGWAAWALGRFQDLPTKRPVVVPLVAAARSSDPRVRHEALIALGRLQHRPMAPYIQREVERERDAGQGIDPRLLYALGSIQVTSSVPLLQGLLHGADEQTQRLAAWALAQHRDQRGGRDAVDVLEARLPSASADVRCAIVHALGILADEASNVPLVRAYDDSPPDALAYVCPRITMSLSPDGAGDDDVELLRPERKFGMKIILAMGQMRATTSDVRDAVEPWLSELAHDPVALPEVREGSASLLAGIRGGRNDADAKTVDEALGLPAEP